MAETIADPPPHLFLDTFERYVLAPLCAAVEIVDRERNEIELEIAAFEEFATALDSVGVDSSARRPKRSTLLVLAERSTDSTEEIREVYRETVMAVPHFNRVYDELLSENVAAELGPDLAAALHPDQPEVDTQSLVTGLRVAVARANENRRAMCDALHEECESIERARRRLAELVAELDSTVVPTWYRESFERRVELIAEERQQTIHDHPSPGLSEEVNLPEYLYADEPWSYPVLTAVTRVTESVVLS